MSRRNIIAVILVIISLACLYPGVTEPLLQIKVSASVPIIGALQFYDETQSILDSIRALYQQQNTLVATLIMLFSIIVPLAKAALLLLALLIRKTGQKLAIHKFVGLISKWSMADVFVVSVFMAFLATHSNDFIDAILHPGFYYFLAYCIISIIATQVLGFKAVKEAEKSPAKNNLQLDSSD